MYHIKDTIKIYFVDRELIAQWLWCWTTNQIPGPPSYYSWALKQGPSCTSNCNSNCKWLWIRAFAKCSECKC